MSDNELTKDDDLFNVIDVAGVMAALRAGVKPAFNYSLYYPGKRSRYLIDLTLYLIEQWDAYLKNENPEVANLDKLEDITQRMHDQIKAAVDEVNEKKEQSSEI